MAAIDNDYIAKLCQRLQNKLDACKNIAISAEATASGGDLLAAQAILNEASAQRKFAQLEQRRQQIVKLITEIEEA